MISEKDASVLLNRFIQNPCFCCEKNGKQLKECMDNGNCREIIMRLVASIQTECQPANIYLLMWKGDAMPNQIHKAFLSKSAAEEYIKQHYEPEYFKIVEIEILR